MIRPRTPSARLAFRARSAVAALALALLAAAFVPAAAGAAPLYWGGTIKGDVYGINGEAPTNQTVLERFEHDAGKKISMVNTGQGWASFDTPTMNAAVAGGEIPLVTMKLEGATIKEVIEGKQDGKIRAWAQAAKSFGYPFLFRPWWEPNGNWYSWGRGHDTPTEYIEAWRHFHDLVVAEGATNVTWAWVVNALWEDPESEAARWYPGSGYVDWVGMDAYNWGKNPLQPGRWLTAEESIQPTLDELETIAPGKPVCICESASTEYDEEGQPPHPAKKAAWIHEMLDTYLPSHPEIKAYLWFNWNVQKDGGTPAERYDWPIESSTASEEAFREGIAAPDYLSQLPPLTKLQKVPMPVFPPPPPPVVSEPTGGGGAPATVTPSTGSSAAPTSPAATPVQTAASVAEQVAFGAPKLQSSQGTAKLPLWIPGAGDLQITAQGARVSIVSAGTPARQALSRHVAARERFTLRVGASGAKLRELAGRGKTKVTLVVRFTPSGGTPSVRRLQLTLRAQT